MATLATLYDRWMGKGGAEAAVMATWPEPRPNRTRNHRLRPFPNEDVHFFVKQFDNTRVIRAADQQVPKVCWRLIAGASASAVLLIGLLLPSGYRLMAGYQLEELRKEHDDLLKRKQSLEAAEEKLMSPERLAELAKLQQFVDPEPGSVIHLAPKDVMAMGQAPKTGPGRQQ